MDLHNGNLHIVPIDQHLDQYSVSFAPLSHKACRATGYCGSITARGYESTINLLRQLGIGELQAQDFLAEARIMNQVDREVSLTDAQHELFLRD